MEKEYEIGFNKLLDSVKNCFTPAEVEKIVKAFEVAEKAHGGQKRRSGEPYIIHPIAVASILCDEVGMDSESVCAALLHDVVEDTDIPSEYIRKEFGETVEYLVDGVTKLGQISASVSKEEEQSENVRKMFLAMSKDIRVIIIKLSDRVHNMRTLRFMPEEKRRYKARETLSIYAPIAHRLGMRKFKEELEDLAISFLDPVAYKEIATTLENQVESRQEFLETIKTRIYDRVVQDVPNVNIAGRIKSIHGIYRKTIMQPKSMDEVYDIYAVRLIVDSIEQCYHCLGIVHEIYKLIPGRFKDYISTPKPNMYQSLHTTVIGRSGIPFEVQIRTWEMHHTAEFGIAAHWKYKLGINGTQKFEERLSWIRKVLDTQKEGDDVEDIVSTIKTDFVSEEVFAFTPKGSVINLPLGATIIDFAFAIHTQVGIKMIGAKVNNRIVTLDHKISTGEIIQILTTSQADKGPSRDWLKIAKTSSARTKIRSWFKKEKRDDNIIEGKAEVEREFKRNKIILPDDQMQQLLARAVQMQRCKDVEEFYAGVGYGGISLNKIMLRLKDEFNKIVKENAPEPTVDEIVITKPKKRKSIDGIIIEGIDNCLIKFSRCCSPLPGDDIVGFITRGHGMSIHTRACTNVPRDLENCAEPERWVKAEWDDKTKSEYRVTVEITCLNRVGLLADISGIMASMHVMINSIAVKELNDGRCIISVGMTINNSDHYDKVKEKVMKIKNVLEVNRVGA
ncbi:MAG: bifunctional (p)ppGpp synthetase/guanosine-3',5'-bis(diphosphate) 3'-pyrophosphohydrolase [Clostridia bacterium]